MNAQTAITARTDPSQAIRWLEPTLPPKLDALLSEGRTFSDLPIVGPASAQHLRDYIAACQPPVPDRSQVERMVVRLAIAMPSARISDDEAAERLGLYWSALRSHALPDLHDAFTVLLRTCRFFPTVAEIEAAIAPIRAKRERRQATARMLLLRHDREWTPPVEQLTPEEARELRSIMADPLASRAA